MILLILQHSFFCGGGVVHTIFSRVHFHAASSRERQRERKLGNSAVAHTLLWHTLLCCEIYNILFFCGGGVHTIFSCVHFHASAKRGRDFVGRIDESMEAS